MPPLPDPDDDELVRFARMVAHGLRNPLAIAVGMLDLLDRQVGDQLDDDMRHLLARSGAALQRAGDLVLSLQRYTAATRSPLHPVTVDLHEVAQAAAARIRDAPETPDGTVIDVADDLPSVTADAEAAERMLDALLDNAVRHADPDRAPHISVRAASADRRRGWCVRDDGPGIPAEQRDAALVPGERLGRSGDGFGLGLSLVSTLAGRHRGTLELAESPGGGLAVTVLWPVDDAGLLGEQGA